MAMTLPKLGVKVSYFSEFYRDFAVKVSNTKTSELCENTIKAKTKALQCSWCEYLLHQNPNHPAVGDATIFISHAWEYNFIDVLESLKERFRDNDEVVWFDLFSINQHKQIEIDFFGSFNDAISSFNHTILLAGPWNDPIPLKRAWCLWEIFCTIETGSRFEIVIRRNDQEAFLEDLSGGAMNKMLSNIDSANSKCTLFHDEDKIHSLVKEKIGFGKMNQIILNKIKEALMDIVKDSTKWQEKGDNVGPVMNTDYAMATLAMSQRNYELAEKHLQENLEKQKKLFDENHSIILEGKFKLAEVLLAAEKYSDAEILLNDQVIKAYDGVDPDNAINTLFFLGKLYTKQENYKKAEKSLNLALKKAKAAGKQDTTFDIKYSLAVLHELRGDKASAEDLFKECYEETLRLHGKRHPETLKVLCNYVGSWIDDKTKFQEAETLLIENIGISESILGKEHPTTINLVHTLSNGYDYNNNLSQAKTIILDFLEHFKDNKNHHLPIEVYKCMQHLGNIYMKQKDYHKAEPWYIKCLTGKKSILGLDHRETLHSMHDLAFCYQEEKRYLLSQTVYEDCLIRCQSVFGENHRTTLTVMKNIGMLFYEQKKMDKAVYYLKEYYTRTYPWLRSAILIALILIFVIVIVVMVLILRWFLSFFF